MNFAQIRALVSGTMQLYVDSVGMEIEVGEISDDDYKLLTSGYAELNWDYGISKHGNADNRVEMTFKFRKANSKLPDAAFLGIYDLSTESLEVQLLESFTRGDKSNPITGRATILTLIASYFFLAAVEGLSLSFVDVDGEELIAFYERFGFSREESIAGTNMIISIIDLTNTFARIADTLQQ